MANRTYIPPEGALRERDDVIEQIKGALKLQGISYADLAREIGLTLHTIESKMAGLTEFTLTQVAQIADFLHIEIVL